MSSSPKYSRPTPGEQRLVPDLGPFPYEVVSFGAQKPGAPPTAATIAAGLLERETQARAEGRREGAAEARQACEEQLERERSNLSAAVSQFARDRASYFEKVEAQVVRLALSIARKVLHREAQVDPLLLAGIVRVALEQMNATSGVVLKVHPQNAQPWRTYFATHLEAANLPKILEDATQPLEKCELETSMGTAAIGVEVQLQEIEQGLVDLLAARPGVSR